MPDHPTLTTRSYDLYVGGHWVPAQNGQTLDSVDPFCGKVWATVPDAKEADVDAAVSAARTAFDDPDWRDMSARDRGKLLRKLGDILVENAEEIGRVESKDNGKLYKEMLAQARYFPEWFYYYAGAADKLHGQVIPSERPNFFIYTRHEPIGVVAAVTPWNSPLMLMFWKLAPALAAGCTFVVKPSEHTPVSTLEFAKLFDHAGFPPGVFNVVTGGPETGAALVCHPGVDKIAFTGSTATGRKIVRATAENLSRVSLELGGKSPQIVFADADLDAAANGIMAGVFAATGQSCMAGSRLIIHRDVREALVERLVDRAETIKLGNPMDAETEMGPVATEPQFEKVKGMLERAASDGAVFACGGKALGELPGYFIEPTIVMDVTPDMEIGREEVFGPVVSVFAFNDEAEAVALANDTRYGLAAGIWTRSVQTAHRVAHSLRAGTVWINAYRIVAPNVPFGGFNASGIGRENGTEALKQYTETKAVWVELTGTTRDPFTLG